jgi:hypothetical protein
MEGTDFFERMGPQFAEQAGTARANAKRQADVERMISKAEYEYLQMCRELVGLLPVQQEPARQAAADVQVGEARAKAA